MAETQHQIVAAYFEECARILRAHSELYDEHALEIIGIVAGLSTRVVRLTARGRHSLGFILREITGPLLTSVTMVAGLRYGKLVKSDRAVLRLLAGARRGYVGAMGQVMAEELRKHPLLFKDFSATKGSIVSSCPRCGVVDKRHIAAPAPCSECGFEFEVISDG